MVFRGLRDGWLVECLDFGLRGREGFIGYFGGFFRFCCFLIWDFGFLV